MDEFDTKKAIAIYQNIGVCTTDDLGIHLTLSTCSNICVCGGFHLIDQLSGNEEEERDRTRNINWND